MTWLIQEIYDGCQGKKLVFILEKVVIDGVVLIDALLIFYMH